jgi:hypothetical protein
MHKRLLILAALVGLLTAAASAGPPLVCRPLDIGTSASLPWDTTGGWNGMSASYDVSHLVGDTIVLLNSAPGPQVQMETLRRAAIYSSRDPRLADELAHRLFAERAWFEAGYFVEAVREVAQSYAMIHDPAQRAAWHLRTLPPYIAAVLNRSVDPVAANR